MIRLLGSPATLILALRTQEQFVLPAEPGEILVFGEDSNAYQDHVLLAEERESVGGAASPFSSLGIA